MKSFNAIDHDQLAHVQGGGPLDGIKQTWENVKQTAGDYAERARDAIAPQPVPEVPRIPNPWPRPVSPLPTLPGIPGRL